MRYQVIGADASTGEDRQMNIEAASAGGAEALVRYNGILVASLITQGVARIEAGTQRRTETDAAAWTWRTIANPSQHRVKHHPNKFIRKSAYMDDPQGLMILENWATKVDRAGQLRYESKEKPCQVFLTGLQRLRPA